MPETGQGSGNAATGARMTRTRALSLSLILQLCVLAGLVALLLIATASAAPCDPADSAQCCACEPSEAAEPAPLPHLYLPLVQHLPRMSAEYTPAVPVVTPTPEVQP